MKQIMDKIQFESRQEIYRVIRALEIYVDEHPKSDEVETVKELIRKLDYMAMVW